MAMKTLRRQHDKHALVRLYFLHSNSAYKKYQPHERIVSFAVIFNTYYGKSVVRKLYNLNYIKSSRDQLYISNFVWENK